MGKHFGRCALCRQKCELTFEHIPPRAAFNSTPARPVSGEELFTEETINGKERMPWDTTGMRYKNQQQGMGRHSLCSSCNNKTGHWYGDAYVEFARTAHVAVQNYSVDDQDGIRFCDIYPLRIVKQVLAMFCSTFNPSDSRFDDIRAFVLDRDAKGLDKKKYKLCMYFTKSMLMKYTGLAGLIRGSETSVEVMTLAEITAYPFGFILYLDPTDTWDYHGTDITECVDLEYSDKRDAIFPWRIEEMNDVFPEHFRTKEEIEKCIEENLIRSEALETELPMT